MASSSSEDSGIETGTVRVGNVILGGDGDVRKVTKIKYHMYIMINISFLFFQFTSYHEHSRELVTTYRNQSV
jgi:hypothetical protein